jgi:outer membrane protein OmpA-like peptidoglycan-associated protein
MPVDESPFGVMVAETMPTRRFLEQPNSIEFSSPELAQAVQAGAERQRRDINFDARRHREQRMGRAEPAQAANPFAQTLGNARPAAASPPVVNVPPARPTVAERDLSQLAPRELRREFERTFLSENQYLSPMETPHSTNSRSRSASREIVELASGPMMAGGREVLQMRLEFGPDSAAVTSESLNIIRSFSQVATANPSNAIEIAISDRVMEDENLRRLAARRFAIVSNIMRGAGVAERQILPVLATRGDDSFVFSIIDSETYSSTTTDSRRDMFGDETRSARRFDFRRW